MDNFPSSSALPPPNPEPTSPTSPQLRKLYDIRKCSFSDSNSSLSSMFEIFDLCNLFAQSVSIHDQMDTQNDEPNFNHVWNDLPMLLDNFKIHKSCNISRDVSFESIFNEHTSDVSFESLSDDRKSSFPKLSDGQTSQNHAFQAPPTNPLSRIPSQSSLCMWPSTCHQTHNLHSYDLPIFTKSKPKSVLPSLDVVPEKFSKTGNIFDDFDFTIDVDSSKFVKGHDDIYKSLLFSIRQDITLLSDLGMSDEFNRMVRNYYDVIQIIEPKNSHKQLFSYAPKPDRKKHIFMSKSKINFLRFNKFVNRQRQEQYIQYLNESSSDETIIENEPEIKIQNTAEILPEIQIQNTAVALPEDNDTSTDIMPNVGIMAEQNLPDVIERKPKKKKKNRRSHRKRSERSGMSCVKDYEMATVDVPKKRFRKNPNMLPSLR